jgi:hypothetical protein
MLTWTQQLLTTFYSQFEINIHDVFTMLVCDTTRSNNQPEPAVSLALAVSLGFYFLLKFSGWLSNILSIQINKTMVVLWFTIPNYSVLILKYRCQRL